MDSTFEYYNTNAKDFISTTKDVVFNEHQDLFLICTESICALSVAFLPSIYFLIRKLKQPTTTSRKTRQRRKYGELCKITI